MQRSAYLGLALLALAGGFTVGLEIRAAESVVDQVRDDAKLAPLVERGIGFLAGQQSEDGSYSASAGTGVTSLVTTSLLRNGRTASDPLVARSLEYLLKHVRDDGGIYQQGSRYRNYETSLAILCFSSAKS